jgi:hypothetical protein
LYPIWDTITRETERQLITSDIEPMLAELVDLSISGNLDKIIDELYKIKNEIQTKCTQSEFSQEEIWEITNRAETIACKARDNLFNK